MATRRKTTKKKTTRRKRPTPKKKATKKPSGKRRKKSPARQKRAREEYLRGLEETKPKDLVPQGKVKDHDVGKKKNRAVVPSGKRGVVPKGKGGVRAQEKRKGLRIVEDARGKGYADSVGKALDKIEEVKGKRPSASWLKKILKSKKARIAGIIGSALAAAAYKYFYGKDADPQRKKPEGIKKRDPDKIDYDGLLTQEEEDNVKKQLDDEDRKREKEDRDREKKKKPIGGEKKKKTRPKITKKKTRPKAKGTAKKGRTTKKKGVAKGRKGAVGKKGTKPDQLLKGDAGAGQQAGGGRRSGEPNKEELTMATIATGVAASVPEIHKSAKDITKFLGTNLQRLGLVGLSAGAIYGIAKYLAKKRERDVGASRGMNKAFGMMKEKKEEAPKKDRRRPSPTGIYEMGESKARRKRRERRLNRRGGR